MKYISTQRYVRISPQKVREVVAMIKKLQPVDAVERLPFTQKNAAGVLAKTINSAITNAESKGADKKNLKFSEIQVNEGPRLKRGMPVSKGRWHPILKRMSHIRVVLEEKNPTVAPVAKKKAQPKKKVAKKVAKAVQKKVTKTTRKAKK